MLQAPQPGKALRRRAVGGEKPRLELLPAAYTTGGYRGLKNAHAGEAEGAKLAQIAKRALGGFQLRDSAFS